MKYEVTIGIPVFNVEKYMRLTMDSALAQTFQDIEFLILDDCGTDSSMDIVREYQQDHPRGKDIRIVSQPYNKGIGEARNRILDEARGKFLFFMDADDTIVPNAIELLYGALQKYRAEIVYGSHERVEENDGEKNVIRRVYQQMFFEKEDDFAKYVYRKYDGIQAQTWNFLIDVNIYRRNNIRYKAVNYWEDFAMTIDLPTYITRAVLLPDVTYRYFCRYGSLSNFQQRRQIAKEEIQKAINAIALVKGNSERIKDKKYFPQRMYKVMMTCFYMVCSIMRNREKIVPAFTNLEVRNVLRSPISVAETMKFKEWRVKNLFLCLLGILPPILSLSIIRLLGKYKGLI